MENGIVCIITVNWNGKSDTLACLRSLAADQHPSKVVIVVDNGSTDDSVATIRCEHPWVTVLETGENLGFSGANNLGLAHSYSIGAAYTYFLNNDTESEPDAIGHLVAADKSTGFGLLTPVIHYFDEPREAWFSGSQYDLARGTAVHNNVRVPMRAESPYEVPWASGCALFGRTEVLRSLGGFDDRFFLNWEDVDLSLRARRAGFRVGIVPAARVYHKVGRSFSNAGFAGWYYHVRNNLLLLHKHGSANHRMAQIGVGARHLREAAACLLRGGGVSRFAVACQAIADHLVGRYGRRGR